jgi:hypothetical protein
MTITRALLLAILLSAFDGGAAGPAMAQACTKQGNDVTCDDGRRGIFAGDAIVWADGTKSRLASPHPSVIIGNKSSVVIGPGVFAGSGSGKGMVPMENPSAPGKARCPILDGVAYCFCACWGSPGMRSLTPQRTRRSTPVESLVNTICGESPGEG